jgi:hypothetical protein
MKSSKARTLLEALFLFLVATRAEPTRAGRLAPSPQTWALTEPHTKRVSVPFFFPTGSTIAELRPSVTLAKGV